MRILALLSGMLAAGFWSGVAHAQNFTFLKVDPKGTYLRDSQATRAPTRLDVAGYLETIKPTLPWGDATFRLEIRSVGWFNRSLDNPAAHNVSNQAVAVFSEGGAVDLDWTQQHRVQNPIDRGEDFTTLPTWIGALPTDISEDFGVGPEGLSIDIPDRATHLLLTPFDNDFWNNGDDFSMPGADPRGFGVEWRILPISSVPEPASLVALALGLAVAAAKRMRR